MQMSLNTKKEEIKKLEDKAQMKDEALERSEKMLEEDAAKFDEFLKKNDQKAHKAFKAADKEIKDKQEKVHGMTSLKYFFHSRVPIQIEELKKLNIEASKIESEISKLKDRLIECEKYKKFLLEVSHDGRGTIKNGQKGSREELDESQLDSMPFSAPEQLLSIFAQKEEENLFLIQILQRGEEDLEQLRRRYGKSKLDMKIQAEEAESNIRDIDSKINAQLGKISSLKNMSAADSSETKEIMTMLIKKLDSKIKHVYESCVRNMEPDPILQLKEIEVSVDNLIDEILAIPVVKRKFLEQRKESEVCNCPQSLISAFKVVMSLSQ